MVTQIITSYGPIAIAIYLIVEKLRSGTSGLRKQILNDYETRNAQLDGKVKEMDQRIIDQGREISHLSGVIQEKDKNIDSLTKILQNRNPELVELMTEIKSSNLEVKNYMKLSIDHFEKTGKALENQTKMLDGIKKRNDMIDTAHGQAKV